jgi:integrase
MSKRGQGEGSIFQRKNGLWVAQVTVQGKHVSKSSKSKSECREWLRKIRRQVEDGLTFSSAQTCLEVFLNEWLTLSAKSVRPKTFDQCQQVVRQHIVPDLGMIKMKDLSSRQIQALCSKKLDSNISVRTVLLIHSVLRRALNYGVKTKVIILNPALAVLLPKLKKKEMKTYSDSQVRTFLSFTEGSRFEVLYWLAVTTGMRQGELLGLKWSDVDMSRRRISVQRQIQRLKTGLEFSEPKSAAGRRMITLGASSIEKLRVHLKTQVGERQSAGDFWEENDLLFPSTKGTPMDPSNLYHDFKRVIKNAGLPDIRFHDLRHYVEWWIMGSV